jgi:LCP family protein required for cell wall assembly
VEIVPGTKHEEAGLYTVKHQFMHKPGIVRKQPVTESGESEPQQKQVQPTPASRDANQNPTGLPIQQSSSAAYSSPGQPYLQGPQSLPGIPQRPGMQRSGQPIMPPTSQGNAGQPSHWGGPPSQVPIGPSQVNTFIPPGPALGINPSNNVPGSTNNANNGGNFPLSSTYPNGHVPGPPHNSPPKGAANSSFSGIPGTGNSFSGISNQPVGNSFSGIGNQPVGNSFSGIGNQPAGNSLNNTNNSAFRGGPPPYYQSNSFPGMPNPNGPQGPGFQRPVGTTGPGPKPPQKKPKKRLPIWARVAIGFLVFVFVVTGGAFAYYETQIAPSLNNILGKQAIHNSKDTAQKSGQGTSQAANQAQVTPTAPTGRTNILLLGSDTDGKGNDPTNGTPLAQTIMIITIDPQTNYVGMLSIPRDMQVYEDGSEPKLDEVFSHGYAGNTLQDKVASGAGTMEDIIEANFGIHIDHYAWVGLNGFIKVIDTAGGIDVDTIHPMVDDTYPDDVNNPNGSIYDYKRLYIAPGPQHLDGADALDYVRTRHSDLIGDFGRTVRQQQIINQLKIKLDTPDTIGKATQLLQDLNGAVQTDMQLSDVIGFANLARGIDSNKIQRLTLGPPDYAVPSSGSTNYLPVCSNIIPAIQKMFNITSPTCLSQAMSNSSSVARTTQPSTSTASTALLASIKPDQKQSTTSNTMVKVSAATSNGVTSIDTGVHGLLDMLFAATFESFDAMQI